ncbi:unnamed protein product [Sphagnum jensenii]|uniref:Uncharacterized protein n=1 Tax=Sphagnum jensenii TaxID=128206 RepID=A0ABP1BE82_9BRYO
MPPMQQQFKKRNPRHVATSRKVLVVEEHRGRQRSKADFSAEFQKRGRAELCRIRDQRLLLFSGEETNL